MLYNTEILRSSDNNDIIKAARLLAGGEVVGIPTETVYGLAADATNENAVKKIFEAKGRPQDNPLIVHLSEPSELELYVKDIPYTAYRLAEKFWPGPLTMVLPKRDIIPNATSAGLDTVGIRIPAHKTAREIIKACGKPLAAPSANLSGSPSPTSAQHVFKDMIGRIPAVVDGGVCPVGVESTVISFAEDGVNLLRPGFISVSDLEAVAGKVYLAKGITEAVPNTEKVLSPGMKYKHYSPEANITIIDATIEDFAKYFEANSNKNTYAMIFEDDKKFIKKNYLVYGNNSEEQARNLFNVLREFDDIGAKQVYARCPSLDGVGLAVYNRLLRAAGFEVIKL
jgi:L-threonylcarbamoyladenylate synthase